MAEYYFLPSDFSFNFRHAAVYRSSTNNNLKHTQKKRKSKQKDNKTRPRVSLSPYKRTPNESSAVRTVLLLNLNIVIAKSLAWAKSPFPLLFGVKGKSVGRGGGTKPIKVKIKSLSSKTTVYNMLFLIESGIWWHLLD